MSRELKEKIKESLSAVLPITAIVLLLCSTITPMPLAPMMLFLMGAFLLIIGMGFFTLGADMAMMPIGEKVGARLAKSNKLGIIAISCFIIGVIITIAEPVYRFWRDRSRACGSGASVGCLGVGLFLVWRSGTPVRWS